jgi:hypothetical protein
MSQLFRVLYANKCTSTHHKLAMDALLQLETVHAAAWQNLFVRNIELYLDGTQAPDRKFKDFRNHVLHVQDNYWGGAVVKAEEWYQRLCEYLRQEDWARSAYAAGVLSHYVTDPFMPLHTAQSEAAGVVHSAVERSVSKSYDALVESLTDELGGYPPISLSRTDDWLALAIIAGARQANQHYETLIDHYNLELGVRNPSEGLDQECRDLMAKLLGSATITLARIFDRAFDVTTAIPPETSVTLAGYLTTVTTPVFWITKKLADNKDKEVVRAIFREVQLKNRAIESLPEDERTVRAQHAAEVLGITELELEQQEPGPTGSKFGTGTPCRRALAEFEPEAVEDAAAIDEAESVAQEVVTDDEPKPRVLSRLVDKAEDDSSFKGAAAVEEHQVQSSADKHADKASEYEEETIEEPVVFERVQPKESGSPRFYLELSSPIVDAPSIGGGTAKRLRKAGIRTVADLLECDAELIAEASRASYITAESLTEWQNQSRLQCRVPGLRGHDTQILVACGLTDPNAIGQMTADELLDIVGPFAQSPDGERILRSAGPPEREEVTNWIAWAGLSRSLRAA